MAEVRVRDDMGKVQYVLVADGHSLHYQGTPYTPSDLEHWSKVQPLVLSDFRYFVDFLEVSGFTLDMEEVL